MVGDENNSRNIDFELSLGIVPIIFHHLMTSDNDELLTECCWILCNLCGGNSRQVYSVLQVILTNRQELLFKLLMVLFQGYLT